MVHAAHPVRRYSKRPDCWHVYYGDVHVGTIAIHVGCPHDEDPWDWSCGFYRGSRPAEHQTGTAETFDEARAEFEAAWAVFLANRTEADFRLGAINAIRPAEKYAMWARGERLPSQIPSSMMCCPCGERLDSRDPVGSYVHRGHIYAKQATDEIRR